MFANKRDWKIAKKTENLFEIAINDLKVKVFLVRSFFFLVYLSILSFYREKFIHPNSLKLIFFSLAKRSESLETQTIIIISKHYDFG